VNQMRFTPHARHCCDTNCDGSCAILKADSNGNVAMVAPSTVAEALIKSLRDSGSIKAVACMWEEMSPSFTIQLEAGHSLEHVAHLTAMLSHIRCLVRFVTYQGNDCAGRRIY
jgi:hypothetical protein